MIGRFTARAPSIALLFALVFVRSVAANGAAEHIGKGLSEYKDGRFAAAEKEFTAALAHDPSSARAAYDAGTAALRAGNLSKALRYLDEAEGAVTSSNSLKARVLYNEGEVFAKLGGTFANSSSALRFDEKSAAAFEQAVEIDPSMQNAGYNLEVVRYRLHALRTAAKRKARLPPIGSG